MKSYGREGFTLVELMVAMMIGGVVVLLAHQIFASASDGVRRLELARQRTEAESLASRWLESAVLSLEAGTGGGFEGHADRMAFSAWLVTEHGWLGRRKVLLTVNNRKLIARTESGEIELFDGVNAVAFDYLLEPGLESRWVSVWVSPVSAPLAVRLRLERAAGVDTVLFLIKGRG